MLYFAYGSNLSTRRLLQRVPSAKLAATGMLRQHQVRFHKVGRDGSAKCDAFFTGREEDFLFGAIFEFDPGQKITLDEAEGLGRGYKTKNVSVVDAHGRHINVFTYVATHIASDIKPFHWYLEHVLTGMREHAFPKNYIEKITAVQVMQDDNMQRAGKELSIYASPSCHLP